ncbi:hypothetical protein PMAYCL1PPCAC_14253 [Pristionchus mayeri]|uniref:Uncharacterized protein n=1 Tax=Pristionchus mayeri TaxID=1317129 RepID=A0AAN4ZTD5_9BILA|nr:hypothetical protein PMAYCL1PPCAC_14253 [Pristionchus mayeri]
MSAGDQVSLQKEPKEEPLDDFPPMSQNIEIMNESAVTLREPKEEPLVLFHPYSLENEMEPKEELVDAPLSAVDQVYCANFNF